MVVNSSCVLSSGFINHIDRHVMNSFSQDCPQPSFTLIPLSSVVTPIFHYNLFNSLHDASTSILHSYTTVILILTALILVCVV